MKVGESNFCCITIKDIWQNRLIFFIKVILRFIHFKASFNYCINTGSIPNYSLFWLPLRIKYNLEMLPEIYNLEGETTTDAWKELYKHVWEIEKGEENFELKYIVKKIYIGN